MSILDDIQFSIGEDFVFPSPQDGSEMAQNNLQSGQPADVLLVTRDADVREKGALAFRDRSSFGLRALSARVMEFEQDMAGIDKPDLLILDLHTANLIDTESLERIKKSLYASTPIVVISSYLDQDTVRTLVQIKVDDWLPKECTPLDLYKSCERAVSKQQTAPAARDAACYTFMPICGGAGCTTLAIQAAFLLGGKSKRLETTCLVDLNLQDGMAADYLDLAPAFSIEELSVAIGRLDRQLLEVMLARHSSGLSVLAAPRLPARLLEVSEGLLASVLDLLSKSFENIVIDLPKTWQPWTDSVIAGSSKVFLVTSFTVPALRQARFVSDAIISKAPTSTRVSVIVNKFHKPFFGAGLLRKDAERLLGTRLGGFTPDAGNIVTEAINRGLPVSEISSGKKLGRRLSEIIDLEGARINRA